MTRLATSPFLLPVLLLLSYLPTALCLFPTFIYQPTETLVVEFNGKVLNYSGEALTVDEAQKPPTIGLPTTAPQPSQSTTYILLFLDPSIYNNTGLLNGLHILQTDLHLSSSSAPPTTLSNTTFYPLTSPSPPLAGYIPPEPKLGAAVHKYTQLLFRQPANFSVPKEFQSFLPLNLSDPYNRIGFPLKEFVEKTGLGEPVAGNYFDLGAASGNNGTSGGSGNGNGSSSGKGNATTSDSGAGVMGEEFGRYGRFVSLVAVVVGVWALW